MPLPNMLMFFADANSTSYGVWKTSGPAGEEFAPGKKVGELGPFRPFAGETVATHFSGQEQTTLLPTVVGVCNHPEWHKEEEEKEAVVNDPVDLDFSSDTEILCREMRCLLCRKKSPTQGSLKVSPPNNGVRLHGATVEPWSVDAVACVAKAEGVNFLSEKTASTMVTGNQTAHKAFVGSET
eukprot:g10512.t1